MSRQQKHGKSGMWRPPKLDGKREAVKSGSKARRRTVHKKLTADS